MKLVKDKKGIKPPIVSEGALLGDCSEDYQGHCPYCGSDLIYDVNWMFDDPVDIFGCCDCGATWTEVPLDQSG